jgi:hypothetical protein
MTRKYKILHQDGTTFEAEGELSESNGRRVVLDGEGKPWLLLVDSDIVTDLGAREAGEVILVAHGPL